MPNFISFTSPGSGQFVIKAKTPSQASYFEKTFIISNNTTVIKFYAAGTTSPEIPQQDLVVGNFYDAYAFEADGTTPKDVEWSGVDIEFVAPFSFTADRRPIYQAAYASQRTTDGGTITFGTNQQDYRKTPVTGQSMTNPSTNGKLDWLNDKVIPTTTYGFERFHLTNIAGWTSYGTDNEQPHFPSNSYTGLSLTEAPYYNAMNSTVGADIQATPYTDTGLQSGTPGDNVEAWTAAVAALKTAAGVDAEITSYQGYRPVYTDSTMSTFIKTQLGYSKSSNNAAGWTGTGDSPGYCPEPGFDGSTETGISASIAKISGWFDEEFIGLQTIGFDGIGLDTGTRVFDNAAGRANGTIPGNIINPDGTSSNALVDYFNSWGMKPVFEGVGLDTWTNGAGANAAPANDGRYADSAYWAYFGSWWGYSGTANGETITVANFTTPSGGYISDTGVVGTAGNARAFTASEEVHCIFQWGTNTVMEDLMVGDPSVGTGTGIGWTGMKQIMWDFHNAGLVVSAAGSVTASVDGIPASDFFAYVSSLYTNPTQARPASSGALNYTDYMAADAGVGWWEVPFGTGTTASVSGPTGGDSSPVWTSLDEAGPGFGTTQSGIVVAEAALQSRGIRGNFASLTNPYQYCAVAFQEAATNGNGTGTNAPGWVVLEREQTPGGIDPNRLNYIPIEGNDGMVSTPYIPGELPGWSYASANNLDMLVFFFDGYNAGDVDTWTVWDGVTTPSNISSDWDTYQLGMGTISDYTTGSNTITYDVSYPENAGGGATGMTQFNASNTGSGVNPYVYAPRSRYAVDADLDTMAPYAAIYISAAEAASGGATASTVEGWYVFGPGVNEIPGTNGYFVYNTPVAWPTGANNDDGLLGVNAGFVSNVVWLSDYTDIAGSGGTDGWSAPPTDWTTYQLGMGTIPDFKIGSNTITFDASYPDTTGAFAYQFNGVGAGFGTTPYLYGMRSRYAQVADKALMPPYGAIYISAAEAASGSPANAEGWYVFGPGVDVDPGNDGYIEYAPNPIAWPTGANNDDGLLSGNNGYSAHTVWLSDYTDATGSGGTDGWSAP